jgi:ornithine cyclodeaminase/alanine dehydrogenase-like protein (mu-crystallin family)
MPDSGEHVPYCDYSTVLGVFSYAEAADLLWDALKDGVDPELDPERTVVDLQAGKLLVVMPSAYRGSAVTKILTAGGAPWIQGVCVVFDAENLSPAGVLDGIGLTMLRTAAVSAMAVRPFVGGRETRLVVFGEGPQAIAHRKAMEQICDVVSVATIGRDRHDDVGDLIASADLICCCTSSAIPLFDGALVRDDCVVVAMGTHEPSKRELDESLMGRAVVIVESRKTALSEAGDVVLAVRAGACDANDLITLRDLVDGWQAPAGRPIVFKSTGMSWQDAVIARAIVEARR